MQHSLNNPSQQRSEAIIAKYEDRDALDILTSAMTNDFRGRIALVSSFGAESVVLLHMVSQIDPDTPVFFGETGMLLSLIHI